MTAARKEDGPTVRPAGHLESTQNESFNCHATWQADQALCVIEGEQQAHQFLSRLHAQQANPDELALIVATLYGATLRGFCRVIVRAVGGAA